MRVPAIFHSVWAVGPGYPNRAKKRARLDGLVLGSRGGADHAEIWDPRDEVEPL